MTSPAGKWKKHEVDVAGNLVKVTEPNPAGGGDYVTDYTYNDRGWLLTVTMPRPSGTQTRTFTYDANGKVLTATNPETGLVTNTYDSSTGLLQHKIDAKNNKVAYTYDTYKRVTEIKRYEWVSGAHVERTEQGTKFFYDSNPDGSFGATSLAGRLAYVETYSKRGGPTWNAPGGGSNWETMTFREMYSYESNGLMKKKRLTVSGRYSPAHSVATDFLESSYTYDGEGRMLTQVYPAAHGLLDVNETAGDSHAYGFDGMGRPKTMTTTAPGGFQTPWISNVVYNAAGQPEQIQSSIPQTNQEARVYNSLGQLTSLTSGSSTFVYNFSATQNDGRIVSQTSGGETVSYTYDSLNRLSGATGGTWTASYGYDGFGNLLSVTPSGTNAPSALSVTVNSATNRVSTGGWTYDANGNAEAMPGGFTATYDIENRILTATKNSTILYGYGADNRRIWESKRVAINSGGDTIEEYVTYWSGQRIGRYKVRWNSDPPNSGAPNSFVFAKVEENVYFGSKPLKMGNPAAPTTNIAVDRLGSIRGGKDYFPYGQENPSTTAGDKEKYATYRHDAATDLSYADQRYYATGAGRFMTADPYRASAGTSDPGSWNRYAYVRGEPVGRLDPKGLEDCGTPCIVTTSVEPISCVVNGVAISDPLACLAVGLGRGTGGSIGPNAIKAGESVTIDGAIWTNVQPGTKNATVGKTYDHIAASFLSDVDCLSFLSSNWNGGRTQPETIRQFIGSWEHHTATGVHSSFVAQRPSTPQSLDGDTIHIIVNIGSGFFNSNSDSFHGTSSAVTEILSNTDRFRVFTILHELAHYAGAPGFKSGDVADADQIANNELLMSKCGTTINRASNTR